MCVITCAYYVFNFVILHIDVIYMYILQFYSIQV